MKGKNLQIFSIVACLLLFFFASNITFSQWTLVGAVTGAGNFPSISVSDESTVFIIGGPFGQPKVFRSTDGGINFTELGTAGLGSFMLTCGWAVDTNLIFVGNGGADIGTGGNASFYKTTDGGSTPWILMDSTGGTTGFFNGIVFSRTTPLFGAAESDPPTGLGDPYLIWTTTDGGTTWNKQIPRPPGIPGAASVYNSIMVIDDQFFGFGIGYYSGGTSQIYMTTDGGNSWNVRELGIPGAFVYGFAFSEDKMRGIAGTYNALPTIARTSDEGVTWDPLNTNTGITSNSLWDSPTCKWIPNTNICYIAGESGPDGVIAKSTDGGLTWVAMSTDGLEGIRHMDFYTDGDYLTGYAVTTDGRVLKLYEPVSQDTLRVPEDYTKIQEAIDAAINGDLVLVAEDTYYENINFKGKAITVASHFLVDGDETHIENTIIDGSQPSHPDSGSVVLFESGEDTTSVLCGFTIMGGTGTASGNYRVGGGIFFYNSGAQIKNNIIEFNIIDNAPWAYGGGIFTNWDNNVNIVIKDNIIRNNTCNGTEYACGGGIKITTTGYALISNNKILENSVSAGIESTGGGIECWGPINEVYIVNNYIKGNTVQTNYNGGGGIDIYECTTNTPVLENNIIVGNYSNLYGGGVEVDLDLDERLKPGGIKTPITSESDNLLTPVFFANNTIINNTAGVSGGGIYTHDMTSDIMNCILWGNTAPADSQISGNATVEYSDIEGGYTGTENIDLDPQFDLTHPYYTVMGSSPCIDAGNPDPMYFDVGAGGNPLPPAQGSLINDMGHCGGPASLWYLWDWPMPVREISTFLSEYVLMQNYPNPFNPTTTIKYRITERTFVELKLFDVLGNEIATLVNEEKSIGSYEVEFNATGLPSGIYFYRIQAGSFIETKKMVLLR